MTIQQAYQVLGLEGAESLDTVEKQFAELYNDAHTRLVNEFDETRSTQIKQYIAELQEALTATKDLPSAAPSGAAPETVLPYAEFMQLIGLNTHASLKQAAKALKAKQAQLQALLESSFSPEMSLLAERERIRLEKAAALYLVPAKGPKATMFRILRTAAVVAGVISVTTVSALTAWKYLNNTGQERIKKVGAVRAALEVNDMSKAYECYSKHEIFPWLKDSINDADRQRIVTGFLDLTFTKIQNYIQENALDTARTEVEKLVKAIKLDAPAPAWNYPLNKQVEDLAMLIATKKMEGAEKKDYKNIAGPCKTMLDLLLPSEKAKEEHAWRLATAESTQNAYENYKKDYPKGRYVADAEEQLQILSNNAAAIARATSEYHSLLRKADELFNSGRHNEARDIYRQANSKMPRMKEAIEGIRKCDNRQAEIDRDDQAYRAASNSVEALEQYQRDFRNGRHLDKAPGRITQLKAQAEKQAKNERAEKRWQNIRTYESIETFKTFIRDYPESDHVEDARYRITELEREENEKIAQQKRDEEIRRQQAEVERIRRQEAAQRREEEQRRLEKEAELRNCYKCKGSGWKDSSCGKCNGTGSCTTGSRDCTYCQNGYGTFTCSTCQGYGKFRCNSCNGRGCFRCRSYGYFLCADCNQKGSVYQRCGYCSGKGCNPITGTCPSCGGDGKLERNERCYH